METAFRNLAHMIGLELPARFSALIAQAHSGSGAMRSVYDLFWLDANAAEREMDEWLNSDDQRGRVFLPFATNGSGESYCFVQLESGVTGIAQALHYGQMTRLAHTDVSAWIASRYVSLAADLSHLTQQTAVGATVTHEVHLLHQALLPTDLALLVDLFSRPCSTMPFKDGPKSLPKTVSAFISQQKEHALLKSLEQPDPIEFAVLRDWMR